MKRKHEIDITKVVYDGFFCAIIKNALNIEKSKIPAIMIVKLLSEHNIMSEYTFFCVLNGMIPNSCKDDPDKIDNFIANSKDIHDYFRSWPRCGEQSTKVLVRMTRLMSNKFYLHYTDIDISEVIEKEEENYIKEDYNVTHDMKPDISLTDIPEKCPANECYYAVRVAEGMQFGFTMPEKDKWSIQRWVVTEGEFYTFKMSHNLWDKDVVAMRIRLFCKFGARMFKIQKEVK